VAEPLPIISDNSIGLNPPHSLLFPMIRFFFPSEHRLLLHLQLLCTGSMFRQRLTFFQNFYSLSLIPPSLSQPRIDYNSLFKIFGLLVPSKRSFPQRDLSLIPAPPYPPNASALPHFYSFSQLWSIPCLMHAHGCDPFAGIFAFARNDFPNDLPLPILVFCSALFLDCTPAPFSLLFD